MTLWAGTGQPRDRGLRGIQAIVQRRQRVPTTGDDHGLLLDGKHGGVDLLGFHAGVTGRAALSPPLDGGGVDPVPTGKRPCARFTPLYGATDCLCRLVAYHVDITRCGFAASLKRRRMRGTPLAGFFVAPLWIWLHTHCHAK